VKYDRMVIAYHGCAKTTADPILEGKKKFKPSENNYDWLGSGTYFWEFGYDRALRWARALVKRKESGKAAVVGAVIQLGNCFDLLDTGSTAKLAKAHAAFVRALPKDGKIPTNSNLKDTTPTDERKLRRLDCAVLNFYFEALEEEHQGYDSVRGAFIEGAPAFKGSDIKKENHVQIAVRNPACIIGVFRP
jgi:hypothetical protein